MFLFGTRQWGKTTLAMDISGVCRATRCLPELGPGRARKIIRTFPGAAQAPGCGAGRGPQVASMEATSQGIPMTRKEHANDFW